MLYTFRAWVFRAWSFRSIWGQVTQEACSVDYMAGFVTGSEYSDGVSIGVSFSTTFQPGAEYSEGVPL